MFILRISNGRVFLVELQSKIGEECELDRDEVAEDDVTDATLQSAFQQAVNLTDEANHRCIYQSENQSFECEDLA